MGALPAAGNAAYVFFSFTLLARGCIFDPLIVGAGRACYSAQNSRVQLASTSLDSTRLAGALPSDYSTRTRLGLRRGCGGTMTEKREARSPQEIKDVLEAGA